MAMEQRYVRWSFRMSTSVQSVFSIFFRSLMIARAETQAQRRRKGAFALRVVHEPPAIYACVRSALVKSTPLRSAISRLASFMFASVKSELARSCRGKERSSRERRGWCSGRRKRAASKKEAEKRFALRKLQFRST